MARRRRKKVVAGVRRRRVYRSRRANPGLFGRRRRAVSNRRRRNPMSYRRRRHIRRNPGTIGTAANMALGVIGGAAITNLVSKQLPSGMQQGAFGYLSSGLVAVVLGWGVGRFMGKQALGQAMMVGGLTYVGLRLLQDFFPALASYSGLSLAGGRGMGLIGPSSFYTPQVNLPGNMGSFVTPAAVSAAIPAPAAMAGLGRSRGRSGRM